MGPNPVAPLEQVPPRLMPGIEAGRVGGLKPLHPVHQVALRGLQQQMEMGKTVTVALSAEQYEWM